MTELLGENSGVTLHYVNANCPFKIYDASEKQLQVFLFIMILLHVFTSPDTCEVLNPIGAIPYVAMTTMNITS